MDIKKALLNPDTEFSSPEEVRDHPELTLKQKIEILRSWAYDAGEIAVAEEEGMVEGGDEPLILKKVLSVLHEMTKGDDVEHSPPTKQGGV